MKDSKTLLIHLLIKMGLIEKDFYGKVTFDFQKGDTVHCTIEKSRKL